MFATDTAVWRKYFNYLTAVYYMTVGGNSCKKSQGLVMSDTLILVVDLVIFNVQLSGRVCYVVKSAIKYKDDVNLI